MKKLLFSLKCCHFGFRSQVRLPLGNSENIFFPSIRLENTSPFIFTLSKSPFHLSFIHIYHFDIFEPCRMAGHVSHIRTQRSRVQILLPVTRWICLRWSRTQLLHTLYISNWSASCQLGFLTSFCLIYNICFTIYSVFN